VPGSELASSRGGPRCMACPIGRDPAAEGEREAGDRDEPGLQVARRSLPAAPVTTVSPALDPELAPA